jgi:hypothetical protein
MRITQIPLSALRLQYRVARIPLQLFEERVVARMDAEAPARLVYERALGVLDATVGSALGDPRLRWRGAALAERSDQLARAARLDVAADQDLKQADAKLEATREDAVEDVQKAREGKEQAVQEARSSAEERKQAATETAAKRTADAERRGEEMAVRRKDSAEAVKRQEHQRVSAAEQKATATAQAKFKDVEKQRDEAESKRAVADRVEQLAEVEKEKRQAERANKP